MKRNSLSKLLRRIACALAALVIALAVAVFALWHNELTTLASFQKLSDRDEAHRDGAVYQINFSGDYSFDEFLSQGGASNDAELISFVTRSITKGIIPMHITTRQRLLSLQQQAHISSQVLFSQLSVRIQTLTSLVLLTSLPRFQRYLFLLRLLHLRIRK